jgi:hypothetical protein
VIGLGGCEKCLRINALAERAPWHMRCKNEGMRLLSITALMLACVTSPAAAESVARPAASLSVSAQVVSQCAIDLRGPEAEQYAPRDLQCSAATPARVEIAEAADSFVLATVNF